MPGIGSTVKYSFYSLIHGFQRRICISTSIIVYIRIFERRCYSIWSTRSAQVPHLYEANGTIGCANVWRYLSHSLCSSVEEKAENWEPLDKLMKISKPDWKLELTANLVGNDFPRWDALIDRYCRTEIVSDFTMSGFEIDQSREISEKRWIDKA